MLWLTQKRVLYRRAMLIFLQVGAGSMEETMGAHFVILISVLMQP